LRFLLVIAAGFWPDCVDYNKRNNETMTSYLKSHPDRDGFFGEYGGAMLPPPLVPHFKEICEAYDKISKSAEFIRDLRYIRKHFQGRPTPISYLKNLSDSCGGAQIYAKREDLNHTGAHKLNHCMGEALLAKHMGKTKLMAETGAGQHGVATATMAAKFGFKCTIYMGEEDVMRQRPNVFWMEKLGAEVIPVTTGSKTLKDAINAAFRDWVTNMDNTHYCLGTACGPHPFPEMVAWFQSIIGLEAREQIERQFGRPPARVYACVGGGSNAMGVFQGFLDLPEVELVGVEAGGEGLESGRHAARLASRDGSPGVAQGYKTMFLQDDDGQMRTTHSVAAGLDYVGVSPILTDLWEQGRVRFTSATDSEVMAALELTMTSEGIIPALESSHAFVQAFKEAGDMSPDEAVIINMSGRGDKDIFTIANAFKDPSWQQFIINKGKEYEAER
jgi:tryptophan synthase beta chain